MPGGLVFVLSSRERGFDRSVQMLETALGLSPAQLTFCLLEKMWTHLLELPNCLWVMSWGCQRVVGTTGETFIHWLVVKDV